MTANQIAYNRQREEARHNVVSEQHSGLQAAAAWSQAETASRKQSEDARHNRETERVNWWNAQELQRHNYVTEDLTGRTINETQRHNREQEKVNWFSAESTARYQSAQSEAVLRNAASNERQATVAERNAATNASALAETIRTNQVKEAETERHNRYTEDVANRQQLELERSHQADESIRHSQVSLGYSQLAEETRAHRQSEAIQFQRNQEATRSALADESIRRRQNEITRSNNLARNIIDTRNAATREKELNVARQQTANQRRRNEQDYQIGMLNAQSRARETGTGRFIIDKAAGLAASILR